MAPALRGPGGGTGQSSDLISQEGKEKGGVRRIRVPLSLSFARSSSVCGDPGRRRECGRVFHTHKAGPDLIWLLFSPETIKGSFYRRSDKRETALRLGYIRTVSSTVGTPLAPPRDDGEKTSGEVNRSQPHP